MWNLLILIRLLLVFRCFALPNLNTKSIVEIGQNRIYYAQYADTKNFPYVVSLYLLFNHIYAIYCSASLLTTKFVLTAAHCVLNMPTIYVGISGQSKGKERNFVESKMARHHEEFKLDSSSYYDIGLVELLKAIEPGSGGTPIKLPSKSDADQTYMNYKAIASGLGATKHGLSGRLKYLNVTIVTNDQCPFNIKSNDLICGMGENFGRVCHGDSGGPLVIQNSKNEIIQVGIVSFGTLNCRRGFGSFYTRITRFIDWIEKYSDYKF